MGRILDKICALILTIWGLVSMPPQIYSWTQSLPLTIAICVVLVLVFGAGALRYFFPSASHLRLGYRRIARSLSTERRSTIRIAEDFSAVIDKTTDMIFLDDPAWHDLVDVISSIPGHDPDEKNWASDDADIHSASKRKGSSVLIFWKPKKGEVKRLQPYTHHVRHISPMPYGVDSFYHSTHYDRPVGLSTIDVEAAHPVEDAVAFKLPLFRTQITERLLQDYYEKNLRNCPQPAITSDGSHVTWSLEAPEFGRVYVLYCVYKGARERVLAQARLRQRMK